MKCPHTNHVEGDQFLNSQHAWACWDDWLPQSNAHFPWPNELTFCPDINGFQIPVKISCTGHRWRSLKDFFVFCSGTICLVLFHGCCSFVLRHLSLLHKIQCKCLHSHHNHPRHPFITIEFIVNVKYTMDWSNRKPYTYLSFNFIVK